MAQRNDWFLMRVSEDERRLIQVLAQRKGTNASEAVRRAILQALEEKRPGEDRGAFHVKALTCQTPA